MLYILKWHFCDLIRKRETYVNENKKLSGKTADLPVGFLFSLFVLVSVCPNKIPLLACARQCVGQRNCGHVRRLYVYEH